MPEDHLAAPIEPEDAVLDSDVDADASKRPGLVERAKKALGLDKEPAIKTIDDEEPEEETPETLPPTPSPQEARPKDKIESHEWAFRRAVSGEIRDTKTGEVIMSPDTIVDFGPEWELALYQKIDTLMSVIGDQATLDVVMQDKHFSRYAEVVRELYSASWRGNAIAEEWKVLSSEKDPKKRKKLIAALEGKHIFKTLDQAMHAYGFVEQCEKVIATQLGFDMTEGGKRNLVLDLNTQQIETIMKTKGTPPKIIQGLSALKDFIASHKEGALVAGGMVLGEVGGYLLANNLLHLAEPTAAFRGTTAVVGAGAAIYGLGRGVYKLAKWDSDGRTVKLQLQFTPLPSGPPSDGLDNPIAQHYKDRGQAAEVFLRECDKMRLQVGRCLGLDWEETPPTPGTREYQDLFQMDLSSENLGLDTRGFTLRHRLLVAAHLPRILSTEYLKPDGTPKRFEELSPKEQRDVIERVYDMASLDYGGAELRAVTAKVAERIAMGEKDGKRNAREGVYQKLAADLRSGKVVLHPKETGRTAEEVEREKEKIISQRDRQAEGKTRYLDLQGRIKTAEGTLRDTKITEVETKDKKGKLPTRDATGNIPAGNEGGGELARLEEKKHRLTERAEMLRQQFGKEQADGTFTGLQGEVVRLGAELSVAETNTVVAEKELTVRRESRDKLIKRFSRRDLPDDEARSIRAQLQVLDNPRDAAGIPKAESDYAQAVAIKNARQRAFDEKMRQLNSAFNEITEIEKTDGKLDQISQQIETAENAIVDSHTTVLRAEKALSDLIRERNELLRDVFGLDPTSADFQPPSEATIDDLTRLTQEKVTQLEAEIGKLKEKKTAGETVANTEDEELADVLENIVAKAVTDTRLSGIVQKFIDGEMNLEELRKSGGDEIYRAILEEVFGPDVLMEGAGGKYHIVRRLISKSMMVEKAIELWQLSERIDDFFADSPQLRANYATFRRNLSEIEKYRGEIDRLERTPEPGWEGEANQMRREITKLTALNENLLEGVFDKKIAPLLCQDRGRTAVFVRVLVDDLDKRARIGNPFGEIVSKAGEIPDRETIRTPDGTVTLVRAARDPDTGVLLNRGAAIFEQVNARVNVSIDTVGPTGGLQAETVISKTDENLAKMPADRAAAHGFPPEVGFFVYDQTTGNRRNVQEVNAFIDGMADEASVRTAATTAGVNPDIIVDILFVAGRKRNSSEVSNFVFRRDATVLPDINNVFNELANLGPGLALDRYYQRALGWAFIRNNKFQNQELLSDKFSIIDRVILETGAVGLFSSFGEFNIQNDEGELVVYYRLTGQPEQHIASVSRLVAGEQVPYLGNPLNEDQINAILDKVAVTGFNAMRRKR